MPRHEQILIIYQEKTKNKQKKNTERAVSPSRANNSCKWFYNTFYITFFNRKKGRLSKNSVQDYMGNKPYLGQIKHSNIISLTKIKSCPKVDHL